MRRHKRGQIQSSSDSPTVLNLFNRGHFERGYFSSEVQMNLAQLPDDIWRYLFGFVPIQDEILTLLMCGNRALFGRITHNCTTFRSPSWLKLETIKKWPRLLKRLTALESLHVFAENISEKLECVIEEIQELPSKLKTLEIAMRQSERLLLTPATLKLMAKSNEPLRWEKMVIWNISKYFPFLEVLKLKFHSLNEKVFVLPSCFQQLPPKLHTLHWMVTVPRELANFGTLPPGLTSLELFDTETRGLPLPSQLRFLSGITASTIDEIRALPRTLEAGEWLSHTFMRSPDLFAEALPPALTALPRIPVNWLFNTSGKWTQDLPPLLTTLNLDPLILDVPTLSLLPRTLTTLHLKHIDNASIQHHREKHANNLAAFRAPWPPHLMSLEFQSAHYGSEGEYLDANDCDFLPHSLKNLAIHAFNRRNSFLSSSSLPPRLTTLSLSGKVKEYQKFDGPFPTEITKLEVYQLTLSETSIAFLPTALLHLSLPTTDLHSPFMKLLPRTVTYLRLLAFSCSVISHLPPGLTELAVVHINRMLAITALSKLPSTLVTLFWTRCSTKTGDSEYIPFIPPGLKRLYIPSAILELSAFTFISKLKAFMGKISLAGRTHKEVQKVLKTLPPRFVDPLKKALAEKKLPDRVTYR